MDKIVQENIVERLKIVVKRLETKLAMERVALERLPEDQRADSAPYRGVQAYEFALKSLVGQFPDFKEQLDPHDNYHY